MKKILNIEDDPLIVDLVRIHLRTLPAEVFTAAMGQNRLELLTHQPVDLCILDAMLPDMDGVEICRKIRQHDTFTPILMLTTKRRKPILHTSQLRVTNLSETEISFAVDVTVYTK